MNRIAKLLRAIVSVIGIRGRARTTLERELRNLEVECMQKTSELLERRLMTYATRGKQ